MKEQLKKYLIKKVEKSRWIEIASICKKENLAKVTELLCEISANNEMMPDYSIELQEDYKKFKVIDLTNFRKIETYQERWQNEPKNNKITCMGYDK